MGTDKALVRIEGVAMARRVAGALQAGGAEKVVCVGGDRAALGHLGLVTIDDEWPGEGPLGGLVTALGWSDAPALVVAGCDQPWLDGAAIRALVEAHGSSGAPVTVYRVEGRVQPLPGVYDVSLRADLVKAMAGGERALLAAVSAVEPTIVETTDVEVLSDVDRPEDLPST